MQQVSPNVYVETNLRGCNPGFVRTGEGIVMIDSPQMPSDALKWRKEIESKGAIRYLVNTEPHRDHTTGNYFFPGPVVAHQGTRDAICSFSTDTMMDRVRDVDPEDLPLMEGYTVKKPSITFSERLFLYLGHHSFELIHLPGHTASQIAVFIPREKVIFTGDNVFHKVQTWLREAYPEEWIRSLKKIESMDVDVIVPGHGEVCDKSYLKEQVSFIEDWMIAVREAIAHGFSKEEAQAQISFLDRYPMHTGLEKEGPEVQRANVERLYHLLKGI